MAKLAIFLCVIVCCSSLIFTVPVTEREYDELETRIVDTIKDLLSYMNERNTSMRANNTKYHDIQKLINASKFSKPPNQRNKSVKGSLKTQNHNANATVNMMNDISYVEKFRENYHRINGSDNNRPADSKHGKNKPDKQAVTNAESAEKQRNHGNHLPAANTIDTKDGSKNDTVILKTLANVNRTNAHEPPTSRNKKPSENVKGTRNKERIDSRETAHEDNTLENVNTSPDNNKTDNSNETGELKNRKPKNKNSGKSRTENSTSTSGTESMQKGSVQEKPRKNKSEANIEVVEVNVIHEETDQDTSEPKATDRKPKGEKIKPDDSDKLSAKVENPDNNVLFEGYVKFHQNRKNKESDKNFDKSDSETRENLTEVNLNTARDIIELSELNETKNEKDDIVASAGNETTHEKLDNTRTNNNAKQKSHEQKSRVNDENPSVEAISESETPSPSRNSELEVTDGKEDFDFKTIKEYLMSYFPFVYKHLEEYDVSMTHMMSQSKQASRVCIKKFRLNRNGKTVNVILNKYYL